MSQLIKETPDLGAVLIVRRNGDGRVLYHSIREWGGVTSGDKIIVVRPNTMINFTSANVYVLDNNGEYISGPHSLPVSGTGNLSFLTNNKYGGLTCVYGDQSSSRPRLLYLFDDGSHAISDEILFDNSTHWSFRTNENRSLFLNQTHFLPQFFGAYNLSNNTITTSTLNQTGNFYIFRFEFSKEYYSEFLFAISSGVVLRTSESWGGTEHTFDLPPGGDYGSTVVINYNTCYLFQYILEDGTSSRMVLSYPGLELPRRYVASNSNPGLSYLCDLVGDTAEHRAVFDEDDSVWCICSTIRTGLDFSGVEFSVFRKADHELGNMVHVDVINEDENVVAYGWTVLTDSDLFSIAQNQTNPQPVAVSSSLTGNLSVYNYRESPVERGFTISGGGTSFSVGSLHPFFNGDPVMLSGTVPGGFSGSTTYYVVNSGTTTVSLSSTPGGSPIAAGGPGNGIMKRNSGSPLLTDVTKDPNWVGSRSNQMHFLKVGDVLTMNTSTQYPDGEGFVVDVYSPHHVQISPTPSGSPVNTGVNSARPYPDITGSSELNRSALRCFTNDPSVINSVNTIGPSNLLWVHKETGYWSIRVSIDGDHIYALFIDDGRTTYRVVKLEKFTGDVIWSTDVPIRNWPLPTGSTNDRISINLRMHVGNSTVYLYEQYPPCWIHRLAKSTGVHIDKRSSKSIHVRGVSDLGTWDNYVSLRESDDMIVSPWVFPMGLSYGDFSGLWSAYHGFSGPTLATTLSRAGYSVSETMNCSSVHDISLIRTTGSRLQSQSGNADTHYLNESASNRGIVTKDGAWSLTGSMSINVEDPDFPSYIFSRLATVGSVPYNIYSGPEASAAPCIEEKYSWNPLQWTMRTTEPLPFDLELTPGVALITSMTDPNFSDFFGFTWIESDPITLKEGTSFHCVDMTDAIESAKVVAGANISKPYFRLKCSQVTEGTITFTSAANDNRISGRIDYDFSH